MPRLLLRGDAEKSASEVPVEWLTEEWGKRGLLKQFQLTASGCVGPCDVPNVIAINSEPSSQRLAEITDFNQYRSLVDWAARSVDAGGLLDLPTEFDRHRIHLWR